MSTSWLSSLKTGLQRSTSYITQEVSRIFHHPKITTETLEELEDLLITADLGPDLASKLTRTLEGVSRETSVEQIKRTLADSVYSILCRVEGRLRIDEERKPHVIFVVGVNGTGKTTTIGKLGSRFCKEGRGVVLGAGDTFRAGAIEQLQIWGDRIGCEVISRGLGTDPSALAYEALQTAQQRKMDVLLLDTAGRLHNKRTLMEALQKMCRVVRKLDPTAPHTTILVLDATTGQNAYNQVEVFQEMLGITGLIITKLDGSARSGVLVGLSERFVLPVYAVGVGEGIGDLLPFSAREFSDSLVGLDTHVSK